MLLAEVEQVAHTERGDRKNPPPGARPKLNAAALPKAEEGEAEKTSRGGRAEARGPCKFFLTDDGCRKGKDCLFGHVLEQGSKERRCWTCGSKNHFANACPRAKDEGKNPPKSLKALQKTMEKEPKNSPGGASDGKKDDPGDSASVCSGGTAGSAGSDDMMKQLLEEASRMLKSMNVKNEEEAEKAKSEDTR